MELAWHVDSFDLGLQYTSSFKLEIKLLCKSVTEYTKMNANE